MTIVFMAIYNMVNHAETLGVKRIVKDMANNG